MTINAIADYFSRHALAHHRNQEHVTTSYRSLKSKYEQLKERSESLHLSDEDISLYGLSRMLGTVHAIMGAMHRLGEALPQFSPRSIIDCGSGPGSALFAAEMLLENSITYTAIERDARFIAIAQDAIAQLFPHAAPRITWHHGSIQNYHAQECADLAIMSYVLSETPSPQISHLLNWALRHCRVLLVVDAGTPQSFSQMARARTVIADTQDFSLVAPCPHSFTCPLAAKDFCHFPARFTRPEILKKIKSASYNYEDEKYSYLIAAQKNLIGDLPTSARIVSKPLKRKGHRIFDLCTHSGTKERIIIGKRHSLYKSCQKKNWGDQWTFPANEY